MASDSSFQQHEFGVKKHHATRLHYDLRLEWNGVLLSWALPEGPSYCACVVREAIEMPDHRKEYLSFEGVHPTGPIMLWDRGMWVPDQSCKDVRSSLCKGILRFTLCGEKLQGDWVLRRVRGAKNSRPPVWTLYKQADDIAKRYLDRCVLKELPNSVLTGRTMEEIVRDWSHPRNNELQGLLFAEM